MGQLRRRRRRSCSGGGRRVSETRGACLPAPGRSRRSNLPASYAARARAAVTAFLTPFAAAAGAAAAAAANA